MTDLKPCPSRPYGDDPRVQALVDALRVFASKADARRRKDLMGGRIFLQADLIAARAALKQWDDGE